MSTRYEKPQSAAVTAVGILSIVYGALWAVGGVVMIFFGAWFLQNVLGLAAETAAQTGDAQAQETVKQAGGLVGLIMGMIYVCGLGFILYGLFPILGGVFVLKRTGKTLTFVFAILAIIWGVLSLFGLPKSIVEVLIHLGFGLTAVVILSQNSAEFEQKPQREY
jgi:hypothetical protein